MWLIDHEDALAAPHTLALPCGAAPLVRPPPSPWAAGPALASGRHQGDGALVPRPGLSWPVPSTTAPAWPSFQRDRSGWPAEDETHGGKAVPGGPRAQGGLGRWAAGVLTLVPTLVPTVSPLHVSLSFGWLITAAHVPGLGLADQPGKAAGSPWVKCDQRCWGAGVLQRPWVCRVERARGVWAGVCAERGRTGLGAAQGEPCFRHPLAA